MMIKTRSFQLAAYAQGNKSAENLAIVLPGFLDTKNHPHMRSHVDFLATKGYFALSFDPPGTWGSAGDIDQYTMTNWLRAIEEVIEFFGSRPTLTAGTSRGGSMAMLAAIRNPAVMAFAAIMSKASYAPDAETIHPMGEWQAAGRREFNVTIPGRPGVKQHFVVPYSVVEDTQQYNLLGDLYKLSKPKLFIAGRQDTTVKPEIVEAAYHAAAEPKKLVVVDADHIYRRRPEVIAEINQALGEFVDQINPVRAAAQCRVVNGTHVGKSGTVADIKTSKTGAVTITVVQADGGRFKTLAKNVVIDA
jgi:pimeloyl-ACP methyl ester carboxylesterase